MQKALHYCVISEICDKQKTQEDWMGGVVCPIYKMALNWTVATTVASPSSMPPERYSPRFSAALYHLWPNSWVSQRLQRVIIDFHKNSLELVLPRIRCLLFDKSYKNVESIMNASQIRRPQGSMRYSRSRTATSTGSLDCSDQIRGGERVRILRIANGRR